MRIILLFILSIFFSLSSFSQISGYMGKRFGVIYSGGISFPHINIRTGNLTNLATFSINHNFSLDYVITNTSILGLRYKLATNSSLNNKIYNDLVLYPINGGFVNEHHFHSHTFGVYMKFFKYNKLAPIGVFQKLGLNFQILILENYIELNQDFGGSLQQTISKKDYTQFDFLINYAIGRNWIISDYLLLGFEAELGFPILSFFNSTFVNLSQENNYNNNFGTHIINNAFNYSTEFLKISLNIGITAF